jgi:hypothetical protein
VHGAENFSVSPEAIWRKTAVQKRARARVEIVIGKESTQRTPKIRETVRHTEVDVQPLDQDKYGADFRQDWQERYANAGDAYETYQPAYDFGYQSASDARYKGKDRSDVEDDLRADYMRANPNGNWDRINGAVRYSLQKVTGKR